MLTYRFRYTGFENLELAKSKHPKGSFMFGIFHYQLFGGVLGHAWKAPYVVLASKSSDGNVAAKICEKLGHVPVRGSSRRNGVDKGGKEAIEAFITKMQQGNMGAITIDGPKGPPLICKPGINIIAHGSGVWIVPLIAVYSNYWEFKKSWDKFRFPKPFSTILVAYGQPIAPPENLDADCIAKKGEEVSRGLQITTEHANILLKQG